MAKYTYFSNTYCMSVGGLAFLGLTLLISAPAFGDDLDPFVVDQSHWISFDHYKENLRRHLPPIDDATKDDGTKSAAATGANESAVPPTPSAASQDAALAAPSRPLDPPLMPGVNKGYDVRVTSTADDAATPSAQIINLESDPKVHLREQNWQAAAEAARQDARARQSATAAEGDPQPLDVRLSFLPAPLISPVPTPEHKVMHSNPLPTPVAPKAVAEAKAASPQAATQSVADLAACAAIDAYKKKQLEAIQSDRQTLTALQTAISQLGLQKQLNFISNARGSVSAENVPANMDMPQATNPEP